MDTPLLERQRDRKASTQLDLNPQLPIFGSPNRRSYHCATTAAPKMFLPSQISLVIGTKTFSVFDLFFIACCIRPPSLSSLSLSYTHTLTYAQHTLFLSLSLNGASIEKKTVGKRKKENPKNWLNKFIALLLLLFDAVSLNELQTNKFFFNGKNFPKTEKAFRES